MTFICDQPETFATTAAAGFSSIYASTVRPIAGGVIRATATPIGKAALVVGGGSGHYPAFAGFVGPGLADAAVIGDVFASPSTHKIAHVARQANRGGGILLGFGNYAGDVLNFGLAAQRLIAEGIDVRLIAVTDDVASSPPDQPSLRRGVAGDLMVFKIAGAAAEAGACFDAVERVGIRANTRTATFGVAFSGCTLPGAAEPLFSVPPHRMGVGLGIHGEPGISEDVVLPAHELARTLVDRLLSEMPADSNRRIAVLLNGLGNTKYEELFVLWVSIESQLKASGLTIVAPEVGEFVTSLDMAGCSLTITWLDDELERYWKAPSDAPVLRRGVIIPTETAPAVDEAPPALTFGQSSEVSRTNAKSIATVLVKLASALHASEEELGRLDALAGDGDHGMGMARGAAAAAEAALEAVSHNAGAASTLAHAGDAWADRAGGTSGALWGLTLRSWSTALSDELAITSEAVASGARAGVDEVMRLGRAKPGDKTLVDAFVPFVVTLEQQIAAGAPLPAAWSSASLSAQTAADATAHLLPAKGRARSHPTRSVGHADAGAVSLALCAGVVAEHLNALDLQ